MILSKSILIFCIHLSCCSCQVENRRFARQLNNAKRIIAEAKGVIHGEIIEAKRLFESRDPHLSSLCKKICDDEREQSADEQSPCQISQVVDSESTTYSGLCTEQRSKLAEGLTSVEQVTAELEACAALLSARITAARVPARSPSASVSAVEARGRHVSVRVK